MILKHPGSSIPPEKYKRAKNGVEVSCPIGRVQIGSDGGESPQPALVLHFRGRDCSSQPATLPSPDALPSPRHPHPDTLPSPDALPAPRHAALTQTCCPHPETCCPHPDALPTPDTLPSPDALPSPRHTALPQMPFLHPGTPCRHPDRLPSPDALPSPDTLPSPRHPALTQMPSRRRPALTQESPALTQEHPAHTQTCCPHPGMPGTRPATAPSPGTTCVTVFLAFVWLNPSAFSLLAPKPRFLVTSPCPLVILTAPGPGASAAPPPGRSGPVAYLSPP